MWPLETTYTFVGGGVRLVVNFTSPSIVDDLDSLSLPLTFISFEAVATDNRTHSMTVYFDVTADLMTTNNNAGIDWADVGAREFIGLNSECHEFAFSLL